MNKTAKIVRWLARLLSAFILLFWGWFILAHLFGEAGRPSLPLVTNDYLGLTAMGISLLGLAVAWKWELTGAVMALAGYVILSVDYGSVLAGLYILWPIAAALFLSSWWMHRAAAAAQPPTG